MKIFVITLCAFLLSVAGLAQQTISGKVSDLQTGEALNGATIKVGKMTTLTNSNGEFVWKSETITDSLAISYSGYETLKIKVGGEETFLNIQLIPSQVSLNEIVVASYGSDRKLLETSGYVAVVTKSELNRGDKVSLQSTLNSVPGIHMDQSHSEDARISIRGVGIGSTFGIRNLKVYINDIPLTEANGFTRIEGLDISTLGRVEIIKGPASSIYGAALGGVLLFQSEKAPYNETSVEQSLLTGSYGLFRTSTTVRTSTDQSNIVATYGYQTLDGYRQWSSDTRNFLSVYGQFFPGNKQTITFFVNHSEQKAQIPGELDSMEFATDPRKADSTTLSKKSGWNEKWTRAGLSHTYRFSDHLVNVTSANLGFFTLDHPLAFAYIRGTYQSFGGRTRLIYSPKPGAVTSKFTIGAEYLNGFYVNKYYNNEKGTEGSIWQDQETTAIQYSYFTQAEFEFPKAIILTLGAGSSSQKYRLKDYLKSNGVDFTGNKNFDPKISPRIALLKTFEKKYSLYATVSSAFAPPVDYEISLPTGGINKNIQAVTGINYEIGSRGDVIKNKLHYDVSVFNLRLSNELIPQTIAPYQVIYVNAGKTNHNGLELSLSYLLVHNDAKAISLLKPYLAYSYNDFTYKDYSLDDIDYSGKKLTSIPPNVVTIGIDAQSKYGFYLNASYYYQDQFPMVDANTNLSKAYSVINSKLGFKKTIQHFGFDIYGGINNAMDTRYASYIHLNAASYSPGMLPKFYNPSPARNFYGGISLKLNLDK